MSYGRLHIVYYVQSASDRVDLADYPTAQIQCVHRMKNLSDYLTADELMKVISQDNLPQKL